MTTAIPAPGFHTSDHSADTDTRTQHRAVTMFTRIFALFAAAGRAVPFHRESNWELTGSTNFSDRDQVRAQHDLRAVASLREHG
ncbi:hypothetical protein H0264_15895 [Nocardia huaxiensis]|uniref:Uncharacterized protein n=1 Tax=Nocardia huaxiensis TaxID=2755382 RepID=A0A7D6VCX1_9NOCA|nr:hypothetical protein [Nocardia huaxiensis]QLY33512.1 hypothetical protein H0264_15895 [Nocardia huaxiensis]